MKSDILDSLSDGVLYALAEGMGLLLPPGLDRRFVIEEILEAREEDSLERRNASTHADASLHVEEKKYLCSELDCSDASAVSESLLERRYGDTMIRAIARDPVWAFAYWDISPVDRSLVKSEDGNSAFFLRVSEAGGEDERRRGFFDIPVADDDFQWYINVPRSKTRYRIDLCARAGNHVRVIARSTEILVPKQAIEEALVNLDSDQAALLKLSGLDSLHIEPARDENPQRILRSESEGE